MALSESPAPAPVHETPLLRLAGPIWVEHMLRISIQSVDVYMLSYWSPKAVAAVGLCNQFIFFIQLVCLLVILGASILIAQALGARKRRVAGLAGAGSLVLVAGLSVPLCLLTAAFAKPLLGLYALDPEAQGYGSTFLAIVGGGSVLTAFSMAFGSILRAHGHAHQPMWVNVGANLLNIAGNALFIFGPFGVPKLGVTGVALATVASQAAACAVLWGILRGLRKEAGMRRGDWRRVPRRLYRKILAIGLPTAGENLSYQVAQIAVMSMIARLGTASLAAYVYALTLLRYVFMSSVALGNGAQIKVGYLVGAGAYDEASRKVIRYFLAGVGLSLSLVLLLTAFKGVLLPLFSHDPEILRIATTALIVSLVLEPGRNFNVIIIPALKGAGDVRFPVAMAILFNWTLGVGGAWFFGLHLGWGLAGVFIGLACDEWVRGLVILARWRSGAWRGKALV